MNPRFSLLPDCIDYILCNYCCEPLSNKIFLCSSHPDIRICSTCYIKHSKCCYCHLQMERALSLEKMMGMISYTCGVCNSSVRFIDTVLHSRICRTLSVFYCAYERGSCKCKFEVKSIDELFFHYRTAHSVPEFCSDSNLIVLPHAQIHTNLRDIEKPAKALSILPSNCSIYYDFIADFHGVKVLLELFYKNNTKSFIFIGRSDVPIRLSVLMCVPVNSVYGISNGLIENGMDRRIGTTVQFEQATPLHLDCSSMIRSLVLAELDLFETFEKYSFLHGDVRYIQFGVNLDKD